MMHKVMANLRMHLTGYSRLRPLPLTRDAGRYVALADASND
jgi:hypothetical protein